MAARDREERRRAGTSWSPNCREILRKLRAGEALTREEAQLAREAVHRPRQDDEQARAYTASKPLAEATLDVGDRGLMTVSGVFPDGVLEALTRGPLMQRSRAKGQGRTVAQWDGAFAELKKHMTFDSRGNVRTTSASVVHRDGRFDFKLPSWVVEQLQLETTLEAVLGALRLHMAPGPQIRTHNVMYVPRSCHQNQEWHVDDKPRAQDRKHTYFTILIHLNPIDSRCGGTEVRFSNGETLVVRAKPGDAFVFHGAMEHRGLGNCGMADRFFYYASFSCHPDENDL